MTRHVGEQHGGFAKLLRHPGVARIVGSAVVARIPMGMTAILLVILFSQETGSFALAGIAVAANSLAFAAVSPWFGRMADRGRAKAVLIIVGILQPVSTGLLVLSMLLGWPVAVALGCAALTGAAVPPVAAITRERWTFVLPVRLRKSAFTLEAMLSELTYIVGPLLATLALLVSGPAMGLLVASLFVAIGSVLLAGTPAVRQSAGGAERPKAKERLWSRQVVAVLGVGAGLGLAFGMLEVAIPAFALDNGGQVYSALLIAVWSSASVIGGVVFMRMRLRATVHAQLSVLVAMNTIAFMVLGIADTVLFLAVLLAVGGLVMAPAAALEYQVAGIVAPPGRTTETFTWLNTGAYVGGAMGSALAGFLIAPIGYRATMSLSSAFALVGVASALWSWRLQRHSTRGRRGLIAVESESEPGRALATDPEG